MVRLICLFAICLLLSSIGNQKESSQEVQPGVWVAGQAETLPLPTQGYEAYLVGELHGLKENEDFDLKYLRQLHHASGLRDVAIEEDALYEESAQAYVSGKADALPLSLCLRAGVLTGIRQFNSELSGNSQVRVHLIDVDSPLAAICQHLRAIRDRLKVNIPVPEETAIQKSGIAITRQLESFAKEPATRSELRTICLSILCYGQGFAVDIGTPKGSPYLDSREEAVASNIVDLIRTRSTRPLLVIYGSDHISRTIRNDGGPNRNQTFIPMGLRLQNSGIKAFSVATFPLTGWSFWRGNKSELPWSAKDGQLSSGETLEQLLSAVRIGTQFIYIDRKQECPHLPSQDVSKMNVNGYVLFRSGAAMQNHCRTQ